MKMEMYNFKQDDSEKNCMLPNYTEHKKLVKPKVTSNHNFHLISHISK